MAKLKKREVVQKDLYFNLILVMIMMSFLLFIINFLQFNTNTVLFFNLLYSVWMIFALLILWRVVQIKNE